MVRQPAASGRILLFEGGPWAGALRLAPHLRETLAAGDLAQRATCLAVAADIGHSGLVVDTRAAAPPEQVVLLDDNGRPIGVADKATVHGASTPRHLAFSCYGFDPAGRLLVTRRSWQKRTFPGVLTNTCCGHPAPGEAMEEAVGRRLADELGLVAVDLRLVLPDFSYRASAGGVEENELCPVYVCTLVGEPRPCPDEVDSARWWSWEAFLAAGVEGALSPWARLQAPLLDARRADWARRPA